MHACGTLQRWGGQNEQGGTLGDRGMRDPSEGCKTLLRILSAPPPPCINHAPVQQPIDGKDDRQVCRSGAAWKRAVGRGQGEVSGCRGDPHCCTRSRCTRRGPPSALLPPCSATHQTMMLAPPPSPHPWRSPPPAYCSSPTACSTISIVTRPADGMAGAPTAAREAVSATTTSWAAVNETPWAYS